MQRAAIWALAVGQTLGYACLYYIFAALVLSWQQDLGWSRTALAAGPTLAIVLAGGLAPFVGRLVDRGFSRELLTGGAGLGAVALAILALSDRQGIYLLGWALIGISQSATLYEVCFAFLIRRLGPAARAAIIRVTLVAGFASTLAFPAGAWLSEVFGWRGAVWAAVAVMGGIALPLNWWAAGVIRAGGPVQSPEEAAQDKAALGLALRKPVFWMLGGLLGLIALNHWMVIAFFVPTFVGLGAAQTGAVLAAAVVGPSQVVGRLVLLRMEARLSNWQTLFLCLGSSSIAVAVLFMAGIQPQLALAYAILQGAAIGVMTILRPVLIREVLGPAGYGAIAGTVQVMPLLAGAAAPMLGAVVMDAGGAMALIWTSAILVGLSWLVALRLRRG